VAVVFKDMYSVVYRLKGREVKRCVRNLALPLSPHKIGASMICCGIMLLFAFFVCGEL